MLLSLRKYLQINNNKFFKQLCFKKRQIIIIIIFKQYFLYHACIRKIKKCKMMHKQELRVILLGDYTYK